MTAKDKSKRIDPKNPEATGDPAAAKDDKTAGRKTSGARFNGRKSMAIKGH
jgi:hypothetical protein